MEGNDLISRLLAWDHDLLLLINRGLSCEFLTWSMRLITDRSNWYPFLFAFAVLLLWWGRTRPCIHAGGLQRSSIDRRNPRIVLLCMILAVCLSDQASYQLKHNISRNRPCRDPVVSTEIETRWDVSGNRSFPSAHAANSAALATVVGLAYPPAALMVSLLSVAVGFSRIYLGVHYPLDVAAGWMIGVLAGLCVFLLFRKALERPGIIGFANRFRIRQPRPGFDPALPWEPREYRTVDGFTVTGFLKLHEERSKLAVLVHGLGGDISGMLMIGDTFFDRGFSLLLVPLRGHDAHPSALTTGGPGEAADVIGALSSVEEMGFSLRNTIVYGCSMGGASVIKAAALHNSNPVAGVICHAAYADFFKAAVSRNGIIRTRLLRFFMPAGAVRNLSAFHPPEYLRITGERTSFVFIHGSNDRVCPPETGEILLGAAPRGMLLVMESTPHPAWLVSHVDRSQMAAAIDISLRFIASEISEKQLVLDEFGNLHMVW